MCNFTLSNSPIVKLKKVNNGFLFFICTCGNDGRLYLPTANNKTRCHKCTKINNTVSTSEFSTNWKQLLFNELYDSNLIRGEV